MANGRVCSGMAGSGPWVLGRISRRSDGEQRPDDFIDEDHFLSPRTLGLHEHIFGTSRYFNDTFGAHGFALYVGRPGPHSQAGMRAVVEYEPRHSLAQIAHTVHCDAPAEQVTEIG